MESVKTWKAKITSPIIRRRDGKLQKKGIYKNIRFTDNTYMLVETNENIIGIILLFKSADLLF